MCEHDAEPDDVAPRNIRVLSAGLVVHRPRRLTDDLEEALDRQLRNAIAVPFGLAASHDPGDLAARLQYVRDPLLVRAAHSSTASAKRSCRRGP